MQFFLKGSCLILLAMMNNSLAQEITENNRYENSCFNAKGIYHCESLVDTSFSLKLEIRESLENERYLDAKANVYIPETTETYEVVYRFNGKTNREAFGSYYIGNCQQDSLRLKEIYEAPSSLNFHYEDIYFYVNDETNDIDVVVEKALSVLFTSVDNYKVERVPESQKILKCTRI